MYAIEDTINPSSHHLMCKMYDTPESYTHSGYLKSRHNNAAAQKRIAHLFSIMSMESVAKFPAPNTIITKYVPLGIWRAPG